ncbi:MAG: hypothetical protein N2V78_00165 [Methanophagales archaeon]|nr:hypothetical protein [Methanophagales archaeon]
MGVFDRLRYRVIGIDPENPVLVENDEEMLEYISEQECSCGGHFVLANERDAIKHIDIPRYMSAIIAKTECASCGKRKNLLFAYTIVRQA